MYRANWFLIELEARPEPLIHATLGKGAPIFSRVFTPIPAAWPIPVPNEEQWDMLLANQPFTDFVTRAVEDDNDPSLTAGVKSYRFRTSEILKRRQTIRLLFAQILEHQGHLKEVKQTLAATNSLNRVTLNLRWQDRSEEEEGDSCLQELMRLDSSSSANSFRPTDLSFTSDESRPPRSTFISACHPKKTCFHCGKLGHIQPVCPHRPDHATKRVRSSKSSIAARYPVWGINKRSGPLPTGSVASFGRSCTMEFVTKNVAPPLVKDRSKGALGE